MTFEEMVVAIIAMGCGTGTFVWLTICIKDVLLARARRGTPELTEELKALREEIVRLRAQNHDLVLSFDSTLNAVDSRLTSLEAQRPLSAGGVGAEQEVPARLVGRR